MFKSTSTSSLDEANENNGGITGGVQKSHTTFNCVVEKKRGFKPSDRHDPAKKEFLTHLSQQIWQKKYESTNITKKIDLHKIFTPATDAEEIFNKNRKLYASSAFYSPTLHPTVEDQVELARRISHSLSDISNQQSKGQSMFMNRKKRSTKWVHEGSGQDEEYQQEEKERIICNDEKVPIKLLMNPCGKMRDINSLSESINTETGLLSLDLSAALQEQTGKGVELFAKRRRISEKWVVDENNVGTLDPSDLPDYRHYQHQQKPSTSPSLLSAYTDAGKHRVQLNLHQERLLERYAEPGLKVVQTPWEAALNSGSASAAFVEEKLSPYQTMALTPSPIPQLFDASQDGVPLQAASKTHDSFSKPYSADDYQKYPAHTAHLQQVQHDQQQYTGNNSQRELAYKPSIPQGWKAPSMSLPKDLYMPKEIPLQCYAPPPAAAASASSSANEKRQCSTYNPLNASPVVYSLPEHSPDTAMQLGKDSTFPVSNPFQQGFSSMNGYNTPPKQQYLPPQSYQKIPQNTSQNVPQINLNPSPLPYDKLAKFENQPTNEGRNFYSPPSRDSYLKIRGSKVRNTSPAPFGGSYNKPYTPSSDSHRYSATPTPSFCPLSSKTHNTPNLLHKRVTSNQILNATSYNSSARGWDSGDCAAAGFQMLQSYTNPTKLQVAYNSSVPYTDF